jgi:hypothetical protein
MGLGFDLKTFGSVQTAIAKNVTGSMKDSMPNQVSLNNSSPNVAGLSNTANNLIGGIGSTIGSAITSATSNIAAFFTAPVKAAVAPTTDASVVSAYETAQNPPAPIAIATAQNPPAPVDLPMSIPSVGIPGSGINASSQHVAEESLQYARYVYRVELGIYYKDAQDVVDLTEYVLACNIINNYDVNVLPYFKMEMMLTKNTYNDLIKFYREAKAIIKVYKYMSNNGNTPDIIPDKVVPVLACSIIDIQGQPIPGGADSTTDTQTANLPVVIYLFLESHLKATKTVINKVFRKATLEKAVGQISTMNSAFPILMVKPDNTKNYEQIIIPPYTIRRAMDYLQSKYGIYKNGLRFFYGFKYLYIMSRTNSVCPSDDYKEVVIECLDAKNSESLYSDGCFSDPVSKVHRIRTTAVPVFSPGWNISKEIDGERVMVGGSSQTAHSTAECESFLDSGDPQLDADKPKERAFWNASSNKYTAHEHSAKCHEESEMVTIQTLLTDINMFTPEKIFKLKFADRSMRKHEGKYRISNNGCRLVRRTGDTHMSGLMMSEFRLVEKEALSKDDAKPVIPPSLTPQTYGPPAPKANPPPDPTPQPAVIKPVDPPKVSKKIYLSTDVMQAINKKLTLQKQTIDDIRAKIAAIVPFSEGSRELRLQLNSDLATATSQWTHTMNSRSILSEDQGILSGVNERENLGCVKKDEPVTLSSLGL